MRLCSFCLVLVIIVAIGRTGYADDQPAMTVWKTPWCGCCSGWVDHMEANGFRVEVHEIEDLDPIKDMTAVPERMRSCHTALIDGYVIEGHVPASDVNRLLVDRPEAHGLAVPGMPSGSPGMENGRHDPYNVFLLEHDGSVRVFNSYE